MPSCAGSNVPLVSTLPAASSSITSLGGTRPPAPITVVAGSGCGPVPAAPVPGRRVIDGDGICVRDRLVEPDPPGRNSATVPLTLRESPTLTVGAEDVNTKIASDVLAFVSGVGS